jgi:hypothetical protein
MSLILDALKKLEREKQTTPRGFLVVAPGAWAGRGRGASLVAGALLVGLVLGAVSIAAYGRMTQAAMPAPLASGPAPAAATPVHTPAPLVTAPSPRARVARSAPPTTLPAVVAGTLTSPPTEAPAASPVPEGPRLQAISEQDGHPVAVIDERIMREGDELGGVKVVRIGAAEVEIEHQGKRRILRF